MRAIVLISFVLSLVGCAPQVVLREGSYPPVRVDSPNTQIRWDSASIVDGAIHNKLAVEDIGSGRTATGTLSAWLVVRNRTSYPQSVELRTTYYTADRVPMEDASEWQRVHLSPNSIDHYRSQSIRADAAHFHIEIREAR